MTSGNSALREIADQDYKYGFVTDIEAETAPRGLNEDIIRWISAKKEEPEWMLEWRLKAYRYWRTQADQKQVPGWANVHYPEIDFQDMHYYSAPKPKAKLESLDEVDEELLRTFDKLGIPLEEQKRLAGVAVDAIFDSVSIATTFQETLSKHGVIFCPMSEAIREYPELVQKYPRFGGALRRQLLRSPQLGRLLRGLLLLRAQGCAMPAGAFHLLPHQHR